MANSWISAPLLKISRAEEHLNVLRSEISPWTQSVPYRIGKHHDPDGSHYRFVCDSVEVPPDVDRWATIAGDCAHNLRSALDCLAYGLAIRDTGIDPPVDEKVVQFPICDDPAKFSQQQFRIASLIASTQAKIESVQPYNRRHPEFPPLLSLIRYFDDLDKHRHLNVVAAQLSQGHLSIEAIGKDLPIESLRCYLGPVETGTELAVITMSPPKPDVEAKYEAAIIVSVEHLPGQSKRRFDELVRVLRILIEEVSIVVNIVSA